MAKDLGKQLEMQLALNNAIKERQALLAQQNSLLQNQATLEKQLGDLYANRSRDSSNLASNMREMAAESEKAGQGTKDHSKNIEEQIKAADRLRRTQKKNNDGAKESQKQQEKQKATWKDVTKAAGEYFKSVLKNHPKMIGAFVGMQRALKDIKVGFKALGGLIGSVVTGAFNIGKAILALPFKMIQGIAKMQRKMAEEAQPLRDAIEGTRKAFGGLNTVMGQKVTRAMKKFSLGAKSAALGGRSLMSMFGYRSAGKAKFVEAITKTMAGLEKLAPMIARTFSEQQAMEVMAFQHAFEVSDEHLAAFIKTAKYADKDITTSLRKIQQTAKSFADTTGVNFKEIIKGMGEMRKDFVSFGHLADEELAAASSYVKQFGGDVKDLKSVMDKFMNFENAAQSVSTLNQAFGMQLDALDMMKAKNPADQIEKMRKAFFATGRSIENMTMHEKKLLQSQTNLSDEMMRSAFSANNQGKSYKELQKQADKDKKKKLDQTKVLKELADALKKFTGLGQDLSGTGDALGKGFTRAISLHPAMRSLMRTTRKFLLEVRQLGWDLGNVMMDILDKSGVIGGFEDMLDAGVFKQFRTDVIGALKELGDYVSGGEGNPDAIANKIIKAFEDLGNAQGGKAKRLLEALEKLGNVVAKLIGFVFKKFIGPALGKMFGFIFDWLWDNKGAIIAKIWPVFAVILGWAMMKAALGAALGGAIKVLMARMAAKQAANVMASTLASNLGIAMTKPKPTGLLARTGSFLARNIGKAAKAFAWVGIAYAGLKGIGDGFKEGAKEGSFKNGLIGFGASLVSTITFGLVDKGKLRDSMYKLFGKEFKDPVNKSMWEVETHGTKAMRNMVKEARQVAAAGSGLKAFTSAMEEASRKAIAIGETLRSDDDEFEAAYIGIEKAAVKAADKAKERAREFGELVHNIRLNLENVTGTDAILKKKNPDYYDKMAGTGHHTMKGFAHSMGEVDLTKPGMKRSLKKTLAHMRRKNVEYYIKERIRMARHTGKDSDITSILASTGALEKDISGDLDKAAKKVTRVFMKHVSDYRKSGKDWLGEDRNPWDTLFRDSLETKTDKGTLAKSLVRRTNQEIQGLKDAQGTISNPLRVIMRDVRKDVSDAYTGGVHGRFAATREADSTVTAQWWKSSYRTAEKVMRKGQKQYGVKQILHSVSRDANQSAKQFTDSPQFQGAIAGAFFANEIDKMKGADKETVPKILKLYRLTQDKVTKGMAQHDRESAEYRVLNAHRAELKAREREFKRGKFQKLAAKLTKMHMKTTGTGLTEGMSPADAKKYEDDKKTAIMNALLQGSTSGLTPKQKDLVRRWAKRSGFDAYFNETKMKEVSKLAKLEAAAATVKRIEALGDLPKRLDTLKKQLSGWDKKKTASVADLLMRNITMVTDAINAAVEKHKLNDKESVITDKVGEDMTAMGGMVRGINDMMDVKGFSKKQATTLIENTTFAIDKLVSLKPELQKIIDNAEPFITAQIGLRNMIAFLKGHEKEEGLFYAMRLVANNTRTFRRISKNAEVISGGLLSMAGVVNASKIISESMPAPGQGIDPEMINTMVTDMTNLAAGTDKFVQSITRFSTKKFEKGGTVAKVVREFVDHYKAITAQLTSVGKAIPMSVTLDNFAKAMAVENDTFTIQKENLEFNVNLTVKLSAQQLLDYVADPTEVDGPVKREEKTGTLQKKKKAR